MSSDFQVSGKNPAALFTLKIHRGDGMCLLAMNWRKGKPPKEFVGFAIEYKEPKGDRFFALKNRLAFPAANGAVDEAKKTTLLSPIQKFRWVHFPRNADLAGEFTYQVKPVFMSAQDELSYGEPQIAEIELRRETYPDKLNVTFTRGFVSSQAFVDKYVENGKDSKVVMATLLPPKADAGLGFVPTHPKAKEALDWMGFEARSAILEVLDEAIADKTAEVRAVVYDLNEPGMVSRLEKLGKRLPGWPRRRRWSSGSTWGSCSTTRRSWWTGRRCRRACAARPTTRGAVSSSRTTTPSSCGGRRP
jgi:hypothetical protein